MSTGNASDAAKTALARVLAGIADEDKRKQLACDGSGIDFTDLPGHLEGALKVMSEDELAFVARLTQVLDAANLYDDGDLGRVYYL